MDLSFDQVVSLIQATDESLRVRAERTVNQALVVRNWLVGLYIVEFEQHGLDRAQYGHRLLTELSGRLTGNRIRGFSATNLRLYRQFYRTYQEIHPPDTTDTVRRGSVRRRCAGTNSSDTV